MHRLQKLLPFLTLVVLAIALTIASPNFLTADNLARVVHQTTVINVIALGMTLVIITGGIDLSVGSILAIAGLLGTMSMKNGHSIPYAICVGLIVGLLCGLLNGLSISILRINPFIVTLGTMGIFRGLALVISNGLPVHQIPDSFGFLASGTFFHLPVVLWILLICAVLMHFVLENTKLGRYSFAIGSNRDAAYYAGVPINFHLTMVYAIIGLLSGLSGMIESSRLMIGQPTAGVGYELEAIAAVVIGGGSLTGGEGSVLGTLIGAFVMGLLANGSDLLGISPYWQQAIIGMVIITAVGFDELRKRSMSK
jgi:ribose transport system permease protein